LASVRVEFVEHYLYPNIDMSSDEEDDSLRLNCRSFTIDYLGCDGVFVLRLIEINHGSTTLRTIVQELYKRSGYLQNVTNNPESRPSTPIPTIAVAIPQVTNQNIYSFMDNYSLLTSIDTELFA
jgi:hypothetical protein